MSDKVLDIMDSMAQDTVTEKPQLVSEDYKTLYTEGCALFSEFQDWYKGSGIAAANHPLKDFIPFADCGNCDSTRVEVIAAQHSIHPHSGDEYWDYELHCSHCEQFTQRSFSEN